MSSKLTMSADFSANDNKKVLHVFSEREFSSVHGQKGLSVFLSSGCFLQVHLKIKIILRCFWKHVITRKSSCGKPKEVYRPRCYLSKRNLSGGPQFWVGGAYLSPRRGRGYPVSGTPQSQVGAYPGPRQTGYSSPRSGGTAVLGGVPQSQVGGVVLGYSPAGPLTGFGYPEERIWDQRLGYPQKGPGTGVPQKGYGTSGSIGDGVTPLPCSHHLGAQKVWYPHIVVRCPPHQTCKSCELCEPCE